MIKIGGQSLRQGIIFRSDNHEIEIKTFPNIEIGDVKRSERSKNVDRRFLIVIPLIICILLLDEIYHRNDPIRQFTLLLFGAIVVFGITGTVVYYYHKYGMNSFHHMRINHGAEHKAIKAYLSGKIEDIDKVSRFVKACGGNIVVPILVIIILGVWISYPFALSLAYYLCYLYVKPIRDIMFLVIGIPVQLITTEEPTSEILEAAKIGLLRLVEEEENYKRDK